MTVIQWTFILTLCAFAASSAQGEAPKKGRVLCEGAGCQSREVPTGSLREFVGDFGDRVIRRIEIAKEPAKAVTAKPPTRRKDRVRSTQSGLDRGAGSGSLNRGATNLPQYYAGVDRSEYEASEKVIFVPRNSDPRLRGLKSGDVVWAVVEQEITASPGVPTPVRAQAVSGPFKGAFFLGEAVLDRELKRVLFSFSKLRIKDRDMVYSLKASGLSPRGSVGMEGEYVSRTGKFFVAELASAAAAGFVDSTLNRSQTAQGTFVQEPSLANSQKAGMVSALSKTTERMAEAARNAPEFTRISGYQEIQVMIQDDPVETGG